MAIRPLNSIEGFSVGQDPQIPVIDSNGNVTATNLTVNGVSNLGPIGNVAILGGITGQAIVTDGNGNLSFSDFVSNNAAPMPYYVPTDESYIVKNNFQGLFAQPIEIDGVLQVDGTLIDVSSFIQYPNNHILFSSANYAAGNAGFTFDPSTGDFAVPGNSTFSGNVLPGVNLAYSLGNATRRWTDLYLSGNTIYLGESTISTDANTIVLTNGNGASFEVSGNAEVTTIQNGNSNISVEANGNVTTSVAGIANVMVVAANGVAILGTATATTVSAANIKTDSLLYSNGQPWDMQQPGGLNTQIQFNNNDSFGGSANFTWNTSTSTLTVTGTSNVSGNINVTSNISGGNVNAGNLLTANYVTGTLTTNAQPNITSVGTLSSLDVTANINAGGIKTDNIYYANGNPWDMQQPGGSNTQIQFNDDSSFGGSSNLTFNSESSLLTLVGNLAVGNVSGANIVSSNYLISESGCVTLGNGAIIVSGNVAGIFNSSIDTLNIGLGATTITIGSPSGNVNIRGNVIASNVVSSGLVNAENITVGDLYSKRAPISVVSPNTVIDQFLPTEYRSAKYTIKASNSLGYQALEVLLVHDDINSIMTVYGSLSTTGNDIVTLATVLDSGYVKLLATGIAANTVVNLMGTYVPD